MALGTNKTESRKTYLSISHGKVVQGSGTEKQFYSYVEGVIEGIYQKTSKFGHEEVSRWYIDMRDGEDLYSLCLNYESGVFKSIVLSLASDERIGSSPTIRIKPYEGKNGYTKVVVYRNGEKLDWVTQHLPEQESVSVGDKVVKDSSKRMEYICSLVDTILKRLSDRQESSEKNDGEREADCTKFHVVSV